MHVCVCVSPLFFLSQKYFPSLLTATLIGKDKRHRADKARKILVQEYFSSALRVPGLEGYLHLKDGYKSKWKKLYFILRASGLYHTIKGTKKVSSYVNLSVCLSVCLSKCMVWSPRTAASYCHSRSLDKGSTNPFCLSVCLSVYVQEHVLR